MNNTQWAHRFELKPDCWVFVPTDESLLYGKKVKNEIESKWVTPYYYSHLKAGGHITALKSHIGNNYFIRADIKQFFNSINRTRVTRELKLIFNPYKLARSIACNSIVTKPNSNGKESILPFGFVQSPIIASLCLSKSALGRYLDKLGSTGFKVTVYMDDIIISTSQSYNTAELALSNLLDRAERSRFF
ncbi:MAG TPA: hypothetical protein ENI98_13240 [Gammaproteobacteria bacterium]|nr:hypothetical protein [Gammaproteobacteria bacterium]